MSMDVTTPAAWCYADNTARVSDHAEATVSVEVVRRMVAQAYDAGYAAGFKASAALCRHA